MGIRDFWYATTLWLIPLTQRKETFEAVAEKIREGVMEKTPSHVPGSRYTTGKLFFSDARSLTWTAAKGALFGLLYLFIYVTVFQSLISGLGDPTSSLTSNIIFASVFSFGIVIICYFWSYFLWIYIKRGFLLQNGVNVRMMQALLDTAVPTSAQFGTAKSFIARGFQSVGTSFVFLLLSAVFLVQCFAGLGLLLYLWRIAAIPVALALASQIFFSRMVQKRQRSYQALSRNANLARVTVFEEMISNFEIISFTGLTERFVKRLLELRLREEQAQRALGYFNAWFAFGLGVILNVGIWASMMMLQFLPSELVGGGFTVSNLSAGLVAVWVVGKSSWVFAGVPVFLAQNDTNLELLNSILKSKNVISLGHGQELKPVLKLENVSWLIARFDNHKQLCGFCDDVVDDADAHKESGVVLHLRCLQNFRNIKLSFCSFCGEALVDGTAVVVNGQEAHAACLRQSKMLWCTCHSCGKGSSNLADFLPCLDCKKRYCEDCLLLYDNQMLCRKRCLRKQCLVIGPISLTLAEHGSKVCVYGEKGCGKSTFLRSLLGLTSVLKGFCKLNGTVAFAPFDVFVLPESIRDNIVFGRDWDEVLYGRVIEACALAYDLNTFENGDGTVLEAGGSNVSGGQLRRIGLARALYSNADVVLLDDPLAGLDRRTRGYVLAEAILKFLAPKTVILCCEKKLQECAQHLLKSKASTPTMPLELRVLHRARYAFPAHFSCSPGTT